MTGFKFLSIAFALSAWLVSGVAFSEAMRQPVGIGAMASQQDKTNAFSALIEGHNHFNQKMSAFGIEQYGVAQSRLELGRSVGVTMDALSGVTLFGVEPSRRISPHIGLEAFTGRITWSTNSLQERYYQWSPMLGFGAQLAPGNCRLLLGGRGGGAVSNIHGSGLFPQLGVATGVVASFNCAKVDLASYWTRVNIKDHLDDMTVLDLATQLNLGRTEASRVDVGVRGESLRSTQKETRLMLYLRGNPFSM